MALIKGFDKSHWQGINAQLDKTGLGFAYIKATQNTVQDPMLTFHAANIRSSHLLLGFYHYFIGAADPTVQANAFCTAIKPYQDQYMLSPVLDLEDPTAQTEGLEEAVQTFLDAVQAQTGYQPIIYTNKNFIEPHGLVFGSYPLWDACYQENPQTPYGGWASPLIWQYTDKSEVIGEQEPLDGDLFYGSPTDLIALTKSDTFKGNLTPDEWQQQFNVKIY